MLNAAGKVAKEMLVASIFRPETALAVETMVKVVLIVCAAAEAVCGALKEDKKS